MSSITTHLESNNTIFERWIVCKLCYKIAIQEYENFDEMAAWLQILQIVDIPTLIYLLFDTHDSPVSVFIKNGKFLDPFSCVL